MVKEFNFFEGKSEYEVFMEFNEMLSKNKIVFEMLSFFGVGIYFYYVLVYVKYFIERSEFFIVYIFY